MPDLRFLAPESRNSGATKPLLYLIGVAFQSTTLPKRQKSGTKFLQNNENNGRKLPREQREHRGLPEHRRHRGQGQQGTPPRRLDRRLACRLLHVTSGSRGLQVFQAGGPAGLTEYTSRGNPSAQGRPHEGRIKTTSTPATQGRPPKPSTDLPSPSTERQPS